MKDVKVKNQFLKEVRKNRKRLKKSYAERVKSRMGEYYDKKSLKISSKDRKNNMREVKKVIEKTDKILQRKKPKRAETTIIETTESTTTIKHLRERKKLTVEKMVKKKKKNSKSEEYLDKSLLFDLKKTSEERFFDAILEKIPDNDTYYVEHREETNALQIRKDEKQVEKDEIIKVSQATDLKIKKSRNKSRISQWKQMRKELLNRYSNLGETFVDINDEKSETLDKLLEVERLKKMLR